MPPQIILSTSNSHKLKEWQEILDIPGIEWGGFTRPEKIPEETGKNFRENADIKLTGWIPYNRDKIIIAEDSGLEVFSLGRDPGIYSARYGGVELSWEERNNYLINNLSDKEDRKARFVCVVAVYNPGTGKKHFSYGMVYGRISEEISGTEGFGYDPVFIPEGYDKSFAELGEETKSQISHRSRVIAKVKNWLKKKYQVE